MDATFTTTAAQDVHISVATSLYDWPSAEAAWRAAEAAASACCHDRVKAMKAIGETREGSERSNWPTICQEPSIVPLCEAERAAHVAASAALEALVRTPAPDWRAWAVKLQIAREHADNLLSAFDHRDPISYRKREKEFPGSLLCAELSHHALAAHVGMLHETLLASIPARLTKLAMKAGVRLGAADTTEIEEIGFATLLEDAWRLIKGPPTPPAPTQPTSRFDTWVAERDRLYSEAAGIEDVPGTVGLEANLARQAELERRAAHYENLIRNTPCDSAEAALGKLQWIGEGFKDGPTGDEQRVLDQVVAFLSGDAAPHPDAELLALSPELERRWALERAVGEGDPSDEALDAACAYTAEVALKIHDVVPATLDGYRIRARAVAWQRSAHDRPILDERDGQRGSDSWALAHLADDLLSGFAPAAHPDQEVLDTVEAYRRNALVADHILNNAIGAQPKGKDKVLHEAAQAAMAEALDHLKTLRATTLDGARAKALVAVYWECQDDFDGYEAGDSVAHRILAHDLVDLPVNMTAKEHCDWAIANGWFPGDDFVLERGAA